MCIKQVDWWIQLLVGGVFATEKKINGNVTNVVKKKKKSHTNISEQTLRTFAKVYPGEAFQP